MLKKTYNTLHSCHNFPAGSRQVARGACICETSLLDNTNSMKGILKRNPLFSSEYESLDICKPIASYWNSQYKSCPSKQNLHQ